MQPDQILGIGLLAIAPASGLILGSSHVHTKRLQRRQRSDAARELDKLLTGPWQASATSFTSDAAAYANQLLTFAHVTIDIADQLQLLENDRGQVQAFAGLPFKPPALEPAGQRPGPPQLWREFDRAFTKALATTTRPAAALQDLARAALTIAEWVDANQPAIQRPGTPASETTEPEYTGPEAAFLHLIAAPSLAGFTARCVVPDKNHMRLDTDQLAEQVRQHGSTAQQTLFAAALALRHSIGEGPTTSELLELEDTDLCHVLEAIALARRLRRVYPAQRPDMLWVRAAAAEPADPS